MAEPLETEPQRQGGREPDDARAAAPEGTSETWRRLLTGEDSSLRSMRRWWRRVPDGPRCKVCAAPFHGPGAVLTRMIMHGPSQSNPMLCNVCFGELRRNPGGAEIEISVLFADVRGSTAIAEQMPSDAYRQLLQRFYELSARAVERHDGIVDKFLGDGVMSLFIPVLTGEDHAGRAIAAALELLEVAERPGSDLARAGARVGVGLHRGVAFVGIVGATDRLDFTALGDSVNVAARLGSAAGPGELLVSRGAWEASGRPLTGTEMRTLPIAGRSQPLEVVIQRPAGVSAGR